MIIRVTNPNDTLRSTWIGTANSDRTHLIDEFSKPASWVTMATMAGFSAFGSEMEGYQRLTTRDGQRLYFAQIRANGGYYVVVTPDNDLSHDDEADRAVCHCGHPDCGAC